MSVKTKSILITGCSSGIGLDTAKFLSKNGWDVYATCRKIKDVKKLNNLGIKCFKLDYASEKSIDQALQEILKQTNDSLSAIFNNGAFALPGALEDIPSNGMKEIFEANFFGWHYLIRKVIPVMRTQGFGRIIQCSSILGFITLAYRGPYNSTKWALEAYSDTLRLELERTGIKIISITGASSVIAALSISGMPTDKFYFEGFLPKKKGRLTRLKYLNSIDGTIIIFESPKRVLKTLQYILDVLGNRTISIVKEISKIHETIYIGTIKKVLSELESMTIKGEFVILISKEGFILDE